MHPADHLPSMPYTENPPHPSFAKCRCPFALNSLNPLLSPSAEDVLFALPSLYEEYLTFSTGNCKPHLIWLAVPLGLETEHIGSKTLGFRIGEVKRMGHLNNARACKIAQVERWFLDGRAALKAQVDIRIVALQAIQDEAEEAKGFTVIRRRGAHIMDVRGEGSLNAGIMGGVDSELLSSGQRPLSVEKQEEVSITRRA